MSPEGIIRMTLAKDPETQHLGCQLLFEDECVPEKFKIFIYLLSYKQMWPMTKYVTDDIYNKAQKYLSMITPEEVRRFGFSYFVMIRKAVYGDIIDPLPLYFKNIYKEKRRKEL